MEILMLAHANSEMTWYDGLFWRVFVMGIAFCLGLACGSTWRENIMNKAEGYLDCAKCGRDFPPRKLLIIEEEKGHIERWCRDCWHKRPWPHGIIRLRKQDT